MLKREVEVASPSRWRRFLYAFCRYLIRMTGMLVFRLRHSGYENVPDSGAMLLVSNHQSHLDPGFVGCGVRRHLFFLARRTLFDPPLFGPLIRAVNAVPVDRDGSALGGIKESLRLLKQGEGLVIFPEGTRTPDGRLQTMRSGFVALARKTGATIVPASIVGAFEAWPRKRRFPRPHRVRVHYGPPIRPEEFAAYSDEALLEEVQRRIQAGIDLLTTAPVPTSKRGTSGALASDEQGA